jgi:DNA-directed RNA polymerase specialized sigma24 family protein
MAAFMGGSDPDQDPEPWVDEHGDRLPRYALVRARMPEVAGDLVQETLLAASAQFGGCSSERSWLVRILKNKIVDHYRKLGRSWMQASFLRARR